MEKEVKYMMVTQERDCGGVKPCGKLAEVLQKFEAPPHVAKQVARRVGAVMVKGLLSHERVEEIITNNMTQGLPQWGKIFEKLGIVARDIYRGKY